MSMRWSAVAVMCVAAFMSNDLLGQGPGRGGPGRGGPGRGGGGFGQGPGRGAGHAQDERHQADHDLIHFLLENHDKIQREVKELPNGVETLTESDVPEIAAKIQEHVQWMKERIEKVQPIRMRDPLFAEIFRHTDKIKMEYNETDKGLKVTETSDDPYVVKLIQEHAKVVSGFVARGFDEAMKNHQVPDKPSSGPAAYIHPVIKEHGKVVQLPNAAQQPRDGSRIVVDITAGAEPDKLNAAIEKVARFVNIMAGAGEKKAAADIALVIHGDATLTVLNADAYAKHFNTTENPNLDLLHQLHEQGVAIYVCGQSLIGKGGAPEDVVVYADVAVSAFTALVNLQADEYSYIPLH